MQDNTDAITILQLPPWALTAGWQLWPMPPWVWCIDILLLPLSPLFLVYMSLFLSDLVMIRR
jgi:hypothetical protein